MAAKQMKDRLRELRVEKGESQEEIAKLLSLSRTSYCKYENGTYEPAIESLLILADQQRVSVDYLIGRTSIPFSSEDYSADEIEMIMEDRKCREKDMIKNLISEPELLANLSDNERVLINNYRAAGKSSKRSLLDFSYYVAEIKKNVIYT